MTFLEEQLIVLYYRAFLAIPKYRIRLLQFLCRLYGVKGRAGYNIDRVVSLGIIGVALPIPFLHEQPRHDVETS